MSDIRKWKKLVEGMLTENPVKDTDYTDHEVSMARSQLLSSVKSAVRIAKHLSEKSEADGIEGWVASKITVAEDYLQSVADYMDGEELQEGFKILPPMDKEKYQARSGLEGPFSTLSGKVVYYDPKAGKYYDPDTDMYMSYEEFQNYDKDYSGMKDERDEVKEAKLSPEQREELDDLIDMVKYGTSPSTYDPDAMDEAMKALKIIRSKFGDKVADQVADGIDNFHFPRHGMQPGTYGTDRLASKKPTQIKKDGKIDARSAKSTKRDIKSNLRDMGKKDPKRLGEQAITEAEFDEAAGEKDACYHKVKSRYKVWPSAYASGALVKCRKVGAKNWGNSKK